MKELQYVIKDTLGIHARPAGMLVRTATCYKSVIKIRKGEQEVDMKRLFGVMGLGIKQGDKIVVTVEGLDEDDAICEIEKILNENL